MKNSILLLVGLFLSACSTTSDYSPQDYKIDYLGYKSYSHKEFFEGHLYGGLSGITYDKKQNLFYVISDDRGKYGPARLYEVKIDFEVKNLNVKNLRTVYLKGENNRPFKKGEIDLEGIAIDKNGNYIISHEGDTKSKPINKPSIYVFSPSGERLQSLKIPNYYVGIDNKEESGIKDNLAFESMSLTPDKNFLFTATELGLKQDYKNNKGNTSFEFARVLRFRGDTYEPDAEYLYPLWETKVIENSKRKEENGIVDIIALSPSKLISLERSWNPVKKKNSIRIYLVDLKDAANTLGREKITHDSYQVAKKDLLFDFNEIAKVLPNQRLDNFEGMTLGPEIEGKRTLIIVSDNNFSKHQKTIYLAFTIDDQF